MKLVFIHGWSVSSIDTFGELPQVLQKVAPAHLKLEIKNIYLGEYISFNDEVTLEDIARAFQSAVKEKLGNEKFACITHSTGAPVLRVWIDLYFKDSHISNTLSPTPLTHLIMLAPANHGSPLAILGKGKANRLKVWFQGVEAGTKILDWLQLGSSKQWDLNNSYLGYKYSEETFFPFVLSGEKIDEKFYDFINSYLVEKGSDGVVRLCCANMNYKYIKLKQSNGSNRLTIQNNIKSSPTCAFEVIPNASHTGNRYGIMQSIKKNKTVKPVVNSIIEALQVTNTTQYNNTIQSMTKRTEQSQKNTQKYIMLILNIKDNHGNNIDDYDMILLGSKEYKPEQLPKGFFIDKQKNDASGNLVYYLNYNKLKNIKDNCFGIRIVARPDEGFCHYKEAEFRSHGINIEEFLVENETLMVEVILQRCISRNTFVLDRVDDAKRDFDDRGVGDEYV